MENTIRGSRASTRGRSPSMAILFLACALSLPGCALVTDPAHEAGWRYGRVLQVGPAYTPFQAARLDCRKAAVAAPSYALVKLGASGAQSRRSIIGPPALRHVIVPVASGTVIRPNDIVRAHITDCTMQVMQA